MKDLVTSKDIIAALRRKYSGKDTVCFEQVRNGTRFMSFVQTIDFVVLQMWPSRGLTRLAMEVKISRSDFLRELQNAEKNSDFRNMFHEFWFVTSKGVVNSIDEIPKGCGWYELNGSRFITKKQAQRNEDAKLDDFLLASLARSMEVEKYRAVKKARDDGMATHPKLKEYEACTKATLEFLKSRRRSFIWSDSKERWLDELNSATMEVRDRGILNVMSRFQRELLSTWAMFSVLAASTLEDVEETGRWIVTEYGYDKAFGAIQSRLPEMAKSWSRLKTEDVDVLVKVCNILNPGMKLDSITQPNDGTIKSSSGTKVNLHD